MDLINIMGAEPKPHKVPPLTTKILQDTDRIFGDTKDMPMFDEKTVFEKDMSWYCETHYGIVTQGVIDEFFKRVKRLADDGYIKFVTGPIISIQLANINNQDRELLTAYCRSDYTPKELKNIMRHNYDIKID